jgi:hypothetical protein
LVIALFHGWLGLMLAQSAAQDGSRIQSTTPLYEMSLPDGYSPVRPRETPIRYTRPRGRDSWARVSVILASRQDVIPQNPKGVQADEVLSHAGLPPEAKWTFVPLRWKDFDVGALEYKAVVGDLPVFGIAAVLPLQNGSLTITAYAPEPLEKECREDFSEVLSRITKAPSPWHSAEYYRKIHEMNIVAACGGGLLLLYLIAWALFFRSDPLRAHWLRVAWQAAIAVLLFIPISSPGETTLANNLLLNAVMPMVLLLFAVRRIKLAIEMG